MAAPAAIANARPRVFTALGAAGGFGGKGYRECQQPGLCQLRQNANEGAPAGRSGQIFIFPGGAGDCHKAGPHANWRDCCESSDAAPTSCSFRNLAKKLGWDDAAIALAEAAALHYTKKELAGAAGQIAVGQAIKNGAFGFATTAAGSTFGSGAPSIAHQSGQMVIQCGGQTFATQPAELAAQYMAGAFPADFNFVMWAQAIYQMYSMDGELAKCAAAERILSCKRARAVCHEVGTRCPWKASGSCLQSNKVYCCYDSVLARIIHETVSKSGEEENGARVLAASLPRLERAKLILSGRAARGVLLKMTSNINIGCHFAKTGQDTVFLDRYISLSCGK